MKPGCAMLTMSSIPKEIDTPTVTNPLIVAHLDFAPGGEIAAAEARALRARGATVVIIAAHAGPFPPEREIQHIAEAVHGQVDAIVSGHHHTNIGPPPLVVAGIPIVQAGTKLQAFSIIELSLDDSGRVSGFGVNEGTFPRAGAPQPILHSYRGAPPEWRGHKVVPDARVASLLARYDERVQKLRETRIGSTRSSQVARVFGRIGFRLRVWTVGSCLSCWSMAERTRARCAGRRARKLLFASSVYRIW